MKKEVIVEKIVCMKARVPYSRMCNGKLTDEEINRLCESVKMMPNSLYIDDSSVDTQKLIAKLRRLVGVLGIKIIFIDYLTCIKAVGNLNNNHERVNQVSKALLSIAKELNVPIVCLAQLSRASLSRIDKTPTLSDFRESGSIEEDSDVCLMLDRDKDADEDRNYTKVIVAKNRLLGVLKTIKYQWDPDNSGNFTEMRDVKELVNEINTFGNFYYE